MCLYSRYYINVNIKLRGNRDVRWIWAICLSSVWAKETTKAAVIWFRDDAKLRSYLNLNRLSTYSERHRWSASSCLRVCYARRKFYAETNDLLLTGELSFKLETICRGQWRLYVFMNDKLGLKYYEPLGKDT